MTRARAWSAGCFGIGMGSKTIAIVGAMACAMAIACGAGSVPD